MTRRLALAFLVYTMLAPVPRTQATVAGDLLWQDQLDFAGGSDAAMAIVATNGRVAAVGSSQNAVGDTDFLVRVYDAKTGTMLWSDRVDVAGGNDTATAVVADDERIIVAGTGVDASGSNQLILRTYAAQNGQLTWEDRPGIFTVKSLAVQGPRVIVAGTRTGTTRAPGLIVRAYLVKTGALAWQDEPTPPQGFESFSAATRGVALHGSMAFVAGTVRQPAPSFNPNCLLRAYDVRDGGLIWESLPPSPCQALAVATDGKRVIVTGQGGAALDDLKIQSFDADTGELLWQAVSGIATGFDNGLIAVDIERKLAYVAGWIRWVPGSLNQEAFLVQAYETGTGTLRWEDQFPGSDPFVRRCLCHAGDLRVGNGRVYAVGVGVVSGGATSAWLVRSYDGKRGDLLWSDTFVPAGGIGFDPSATVTVAVDRGRAFVGGFGFDASGDADFIVRAYDAR